MTLVDYMDDMEVVNFLNRIYDEKGFQGIVNILESETRQYGSMKVHPNGLYEFTTGGWSENEWLLSMCNHIVCKFHRHYVGWLRGGSWWFAENTDDYRFNIAGEKK